MTIDVLFIHSAGTQAGGQGSSLLVKHLRRELGPGYTLTCPRMPVPDEPSCERWKQKLEKLLPARRSPRILIGHSLGGSMLLKYLSETQRTVGADALFVVAAPFWGSPGWQIEEFVLRDDFSHFLPDALPIHLYQSQDDEVVPVDHLSRYARAIPRARVRQVKGGGHTFANGLRELVQDIRALPIRDDR
ncbi:alpha/beta fold hydrolase [Uliginosibacterium sp. H1]|uniref:alpha/beta fold hydrolase n=1 Tax=Uliginosibacterium sp. H1 TaxID=3114757 RepID=UPI002E19C7BB|nr:alpha/beta fold hydrolase [Uliginosibacterium sp. H1]